MGFSRISEDVGADCFGASEQKIESLLKKLNRFSNKLNNKDSEKLKNFLPTLY
jgi:hypothetical protein